jgi:carbon monoxide dehydrogenase subunit G
MPQATNKTTINRPARQVFDYLADSGTWSKNETTIVETRPAGKVSKGWKGVSVRKQGGRSYDAHITITEFEQDKTLVMEGAGGGTWFRSAQTVAPAPGGAATEVTTTITLKGTSLLMKLMMPMVGGTVRKALDGTMANFKKNIEST